MSIHIKHLLTNLVKPETDWKCLLLQQWKQIVGNLHTNVTLEKVLDDTLILGVYDSCWLQELYLLSPILIKRINATLEKPCIKQVRFKQIAPYASSKQKKEVTSQEKTIKKRTLTPREQQALKQISDPELRAALTAFLNRCHQER